MRFVNKLLASLVTLRRKVNSVKPKFISLNSILLTGLLTLFQLYLVANRFRLLKEMSINSASFAAFLATDTEFYHANFTRSLLINTCLLTLSLVFTILFCLVNPIRLGVYSHDNFKLGKSFDKKSVKLASKSRKTTTVSTISDGVMSCSSSDDLGINNKSSSKQPLTSKSSSSFINDCVSLDSSCPYSSWIKKLPPLGSLFHIAAALCLLVAELQINSKRIQMGQKPLGDTFSTKMDFLVGEPIVRLKSFNTYNRPSDTPSEYVLNDVIYSKDDFSLFNNFKSSDTLKSSSSSFWSFLFNSKHSISLSYLNLIIALTIYSVKIAQTFWYTSYLFTVVVFLYSSLVTMTVVVSFCSFEVLFKSNNLRKIARHLLFSSIDDNQSRFKSSNDTDYFNLLYSKINFNLGHDVIITLIYLTTTLILVANCFIFVLYGYKKFNKFKIKVESIIWSYFLNHTKQGSESNMSLIESDETSTSSSSSSNNIKNATIGQSKITRRQLRFLKLYTENLTSSLFFLIYSILRSLFLYESYVVFKYTNDFLFIINIFIELFVLVLWALMLILITVKTKWSFRINSSYKLVYWNWIHYENARRSRTKSASKIDTDELGKILRLGAVSDMESKRNSMAVNNHKTVNDSDIIIKTISEKTYSNVTKSKSSINCLLVRDDSILNRSSSQSNNRRNSSHLSSSSITEVSSLMPSGFFNNPYANNSNRKSAADANTSHYGITSSNPLTNIMSSSASSKFTESGIFGSNPLNSDGTNHGTSNDEDKSTPSANRSSRVGGSKKKPNIPSSSSSSSASSFMHNYSNHRGAVSLISNQQSSYRAQRFLEGANFMIDDDEYELGGATRQQQRSYSCRKYPPINRHTVYTIGESQLEQTNPSELNDANSSSSASSSFTKTTNNSTQVKNAHVLLTDSTSFNSATVDSGHESIDSPMAPPPPNHQFKTNSSMATNRRLSSSLDTRC